MTTPACKWPDCACDTKCEDDAMTPDKHNLAELRKVAEAATKAAPGDWEEDACMDGSYRHSQVLFLNDRGQVVSLCDTLNAYHNLDPDERREIGEHIARFDPPTVLALIKRIEDAEAGRDETRFKLGVYRDHTDLSGMSWNGFNIIGDRASIREVQRIENNSAQLEIYQAAFDNRLKAAQSALAAAQKRIEALSEAVDEAEDLAELVNNYDKFRHDDTAVEVRLGTLRRLNRDLRAARALDKGEEKIPLPTRNNS